MIIIRSDETTAWNVNTTRYDTTYDPLVNKSCKIAVKIGKKLTRYLHMQRKFFP